MTWLYYIAWLLVASQLVFMYQMGRNYRYALKKSRKKRGRYCPKTVLIIPCKGSDTNFEQNIASFFNLDYNNYLLWFVVENASDPAYDELSGLKAKLAATTKAKDIQIHIAGKAGDSGNGTTKYFCSQKIHNLLYCCNRVPSDTEIIAFADSDISVAPCWLSHLVFPLRKSRHGAATGYRWFVPQKNNLAALALTSVNAKIAQLLGDTSFNRAWGGSMAVRVDTFRQLDLNKIWANALSDDLSLTLAVKKAGKKIVFVPACLVASHENITFKQLFEFGKRQFLITRICAPGTWWFGLFSSLYSVLGLWGTAAMAVYAATTTISNVHLHFFIAVAVFFFAAHLARAVLRQKMAVAILQNEREKMKASIVADITLFGLWSLLLLYLILSSAFGRTITWRGVRYKLLSRDKIVFLEN